MTPNFIAGGDAFWEYNRRLQTLSNMLRRKNIDAIQTQLLTKKIDRNQQPIANDETANDALRQFFRKIRSKIPSA